MVKYIGYVNQQEVKGAIGMKGGVNPIATMSKRRPNYVEALQIRDRQQFLSRYTWENLPKGMNAKLMERILYYRGRLVVFREGDEYFTVPFALSGNIDVYGRYRTVSPLTFNGTVGTDSDGNQALEDGEFLPGKLLEIAYDPDMVDGKDAVILNDYSSGYTEWIIPRFKVNEQLNDDLADIIVLIRHNLISSARINSVRVLDEGQKQSVYEEFGDLEREILDNGKRIFAVTGPTQMDELFRDKSLETQDYWECYVSLDNLRENLMGIENNGIFKKKERVLKGEQELEAGSADLVYEDGLYQRQLFSVIFNQLFGENIWCRESDMIAGVEEDILDGEETESDMADDNGTE